MIIRPRHWPIRARLTALYASAFLAFGAVLVAFTYFLVADSLLVPGGGGFRQLDVGELPIDRADVASVTAIRQALLDYRDDTLDRLLVWSIVALLVALVLAVTLGWVLAGRALAPLQSVTSTARRVVDTRLHERIGLAGPQDEVKELADTIDAMLERLDRSFDAQRRFVANASHELRTPLAVNRTIAEVTLGRERLSEETRELAENVLATNARSERMVEGLLTLARAEQAVTDPVAVDLAEIAAAVIGQEAAAVRRAGIDLQSSASPAPVAGNGLLLERLVENLVQNVIRHGSDAATIVTGTDGTTSFIEVSNAGPLLRAYEVEDLFEPFRRGRGRVTGDEGVGLGLAIVRSVARAHGGTAHARPRDGGGLVVRVVLPTPVPDQG